MEDINKVLGLGETISTFPDKKERIGYPITMMKFQVFMKNFAMINPKLLWTNFLYEETMQALRGVLVLSFKDEEDIDGLLEQITNENFSDIMNAIKVANGFEDIGDQDPNKVEV